MDNKINIWSLPVEERNKLVINDYPEIKELEDRLLGIGGEKVVLFPFAVIMFISQRPIFDSLSENGKIWPTERVGYIKGQRSGCHDNSMKYVARNKHCIVVTGFALSDDGIWRNHSWVWNKKKERVLETTVKREIYFGVEINSFTNH